ncbi:MAG: hypothetical protein ACREL7_15280 [Longimicrobiales bacterium]
MPEVLQFVSTVRAQNANIRVTFPDSIKYTQIPVAIKEQLVQFSLLYGGAEVQVRGYGPSFYGGGGGQRAELLHQDPVQLRAGPADRGGVGRQA